MVLRLSRASTLVLVAWTLACGSTSRRPSLEEQRAAERDAARRAAIEQVARDSVWIAQSPVCRPPAMLDTAGWRRPLMQWGMLSFALPPSFALDTGAPRYWHGGMRWRADSVDFGYFNEHTGAGSFRGRGARCRMALGGRPALLVSEEAPRRRSLYAWFYEERRLLPVSILEGTGRDARDMPLLWTIVRTVRPDSIRPRNSPNPRLLGACCPDTDSAVVALVRRYESTPEAARPPELAILPYRLTSGIEDRQRVVIRHHDMWIMYWMGILGSHRPIPPLPEVNFREEMLVVASMGTRATGGYTISIDSVSVVRDTLRVVVRERRPGRRCGVTGALTAPVALARLERTELPIAFVSRTTVRNCP
jgi:hypothetical protein